VRSATGITGGTIRATEPFRGHVLDVHAQDMTTGSGANPGFGYNTWLNSAAKFVTAGIGDRKVGQCISTPVMWFRS
jgi:hypothetical protein